MPKKPESNTTGRSAVITARREWAFFDQLPSQVRAYLREESPFDWTSEGVFRIYIKAAKDVKRTVAILREIDRLELNAARAREKKELLRVYEPLAYRAPRRRAAGTGRQRQERRPGGQSTPKPFWPPVAF